MTKLIPSFTTISNLIFNIPLHYFFLITFIIFIFIDNLIYQITIIILVYLDILNAILFKLFLILNIYALQSKYSECSIQNIIKEYILIFHIYGETRFIKKYLSSLFVLTFFNDNRRCTTTTVTDSSNT